MKKEGRQEKRTGIKMPKNLKFRGNKKAVSTVIGTLLVIAILVMVYSIIQVSQVPAWNKGVELEHMNVVYSDMMFLKSDIENAAMLETPKSSNIHMGVRYPDRMIFRNSGVGVAGQLKVEDDVKITVNYTVNISGTLISNETTYNSSRIMYKASGTIASPTLVYEHGVIIKDFGTTNRTTDEQPLIAGDNIYIPVVNGTSNSRSSMEIESLEIKPYTETNTTTGIEYVNITMDTNYPEVWKELLEGYTTANVTGDKIYINSSATRHIVFPNQTATGTGALYAGMITFSTEAIEGGGDGNGNGNGNGGDFSDDIEEDTTNVSIEGPHNKKLEGLTLTNNGETPIKIEFIRVSWDPDGEELKLIEIDDVQVTYTGSESAPSGTWLGLKDIKEKILYPDVTATIYFEFYSDMTGKDFTIDFLLNDGSMKTVTCSP